MTLKYYTHHNFDLLPQLKKMNKTDISTMKVISSVLPFRVNSYVLDELINWEDIPNDPIFQITFPQEGMLPEEGFKKLYNFLKKDQLSSLEAKLLIGKIRSDLNAHPSGQLEHNIPLLNGHPIDGIQHKYRETVLFFPAKGQTCHSYCTFCFRWAQFIGDKKLRFSSSSADQLKEYLLSKPDVTDIIFTGGDPLVTTAKSLATFIDPLLTDELSHIKNIRIGTKALTYYPNRFLGDKDSSDLLLLFEKITKTGRCLSIMAHYNHWAEMRPQASLQAIQAIRNTGAVIRTQGPILAHVNDCPDVWAKMWKQQVQLGMQPYYMFVERDTGAKNYFELPLERTWNVYREAIRQVSGLARTARGPSMSALPGKIQINGIAEVKGEKVFILSFLQARNPQWVNIPFFATYDPKATWLNGLKPAFGQTKFFFED